MYENTRFRQWGDFNNIPLSKFVGCEKQNVIPDLILFTQIVGPTTGIFPNFKFPVEFLLLLFDTSLLEHIHSVSD